MLDIIQNLTALIGRIFLSFIFVFSGFHKIFEFSESVALTASKALPFPTLMTVIALIIEIGAGLMLLLGWHARTGAVILGIFIVVVNLTFHPFWSYPSDQFGLQMTMFWKNLSILGGMLYVFAFGAGKYSLSYLQHHKRR